MSEEIVTLDYYDPHQFSFVRRDFSTSQIEYVIANWGRELRTERITNFRYPEDQDVSLDDFTKVVLRNGDSLYTQNNLSDFTHTRLTQIRKCSQSTVDRIPRGAKTSFRRYNLINGRTKCVNCDVHKVVEIVTNHDRSIPIGKKGICALSVAKVRDSEPILYLTDPIEDFDKGPFTVVITDDQEWLRGPSRVSRLQL